MSLFFPYFVTPLRRPIVRFGTHEQCELQSADTSMSITDNDIETIVEICNEPLVYKRLFRRMFSDQPYPRAQAEKFLAWAHEGWQNNTWFVFLIRDAHHKIIAAIDIQSMQIDGAEIGYWASTASPGVMTNAVIQLCEIAREAGYQQLVALIAPDNKKSANVVMRAGFVHTDDIERDSRHYVQFTKNL